MMCISVPLFFPSDSIQIFPPCASTIPLQTDKPMPVPLLIVYKSIFFPYLKRFSHRTKALYCDMGKYRLADDFFFCVAKNLCICIIASDDYSFVVNCSLERGRFFAYIFVVYAFDDIRYFLLSLTTFSYIFRLDFRSSSRGQYFISSILLQRELNRNIGCLTRSFSFTIRYFTFFEVFLYKILILRL